MKQVAYLICVLYYSNVIDCECLYEYNIQPESVYKCNPVQCRCSLELICSATIPNITNNNVTIDWFVSNSSVMASTRVKGHETITKKSDNYIISRVILKQNQLSTCYWCSIINPDYNGTLKISNIIHIQYDTTATTACDNASVLVAQINNTCAVVNKSHDSSDNVNGVTVIFISCMCTIISVLLFLFLGTVYWRLHNHKDVPLLRAKIVSYDIYREPTEIDLQELAVSFS